MDQPQPSSAPGPHPSDDHPSLLESLAARLKAATAKLPPPTATATTASADSANTNATPAPASESASSSSPSSPLLISDLVACCEALLPFFDHLGPVFHVARGELHSKVEAVRAAGPSSHPLHDLVRSDVASRRATTKGSATRSLHRLGGTLLFIKVLFEKLLVAGGGMHHPHDHHDNETAPDEGGLASGFAAAVRRLSGAGGNNDATGGCKPVTLREAASEAYEKALAPWHTMVVKGVVRAGMLTLPSRETFLAACGESEVTARHHASAAVEAAARLLDELERLLRGIKMPTSDVWLWPG